MLINYYLKLIVINSIVKSEKIIQCQIWVNISEKVEMTQTKLHVQQLKQKSKDSF